ncbi:EMYY motif lipoprotein [Jeotgalicoccus psychrophilus]|uniref:EMYY motif lipoprotein n=1 Tax=Jeotgalicoccus psychrophilus TaxID=157228 RepID=UPI0004193E45|nr:EMYY motif lipoprotein [Jeotgalicoccus psychrophilus]
MNDKSLILRPFGLLLVLLLAACGNNLKADLHTYEESTKQLISLNNEFNSTVNNMNFDKLQAMYYADEEVDIEYLQNLKTEVDENLVPITDSLSEELDNIEVTNSELEEVHRIISESISVKQDFTSQMSSFLDSYVLSIDSNSQLVSLSQSFITHQEERDNIIESAESPEEIDEINQLIEVINANSEGLDEHSTEFHNKKSVEEKEQYANEILLPMLDDHIAALNALNISTDKATRARTISLEMHYNYRTYFEERKKVMGSVENLQEVSLQNVLPLVETAATLDSQYEEALENQKNEAR